VTFSQVIKVNEWKWMMVAAVYQSQ